MQHAYKWYETGDSDEFFQALGGEAVFFASLWLARSGPAGKGGGAGAQGPGKPPPGAVSPATQAKVAAARANLGKAAGELGADGKPNAGGVQAAKGELAQAQAKANAEAAAKVGANKANVVPVLRMAPADQPGKPGGEGTPPGGKPPAGQQTPPAEQPGAQPGGTGTPATQNPAPTRPAPRITITDQTEGAFIAKVEVPGKGSFSIFATIKKVGDRLILEKLDVGEATNAAGQPLGTWAEAQGQFGAGDLLAAARELGRLNGAKVVEIHGSVRGTGARPGHKPRPIIVKVD